MSARTVSTRRTATTVAGALLAAGALLSVSACGAGQISQTANQVAAINGANKTFVDEQVAFNDVHVMYPVTDGKGKLAFVITNKSTTQTIKLVSITDEKNNKATIGDGDRTIKAGQALYGPAPAGAYTGTPTEGVYPTRLDVTFPVSADWRPGLTNKLTFHMDRDGKDRSFVIDVPLEPGATSPSEAAVAEKTGSADDAHEGGH